MDYRHIERDCFKKNGKLFVQKAVWFDAKEQKYVMLDYNKPVAIHYVNNFFFEDDHVYQYLADTNIFKAGSYAHHEIIDDKLQQKFFYENQQNIFSVFHTDNYLKKYDPYFEELKGMGRTIQPVVKGGINDTMNAWFKAWYANEENIENYGKHLVVKSSSIHGYSCRFTVIVTEST